MVNKQEEQYNFVYSFLMDIKGSTKAGEKLTAQQHVQFYEGLMKQIGPHLEKLYLKDILIKFKGDGWLLMTNDSRKIPSLCCLAIIMANRFQTEISKESKIPIDRIPPLRLAICSGYDIKVTLPTGSTDWAGDSARRANRASRFCQDNEIIIDETIRTAARRDFLIEPITNRHIPARREGEEQFPVHTLTGIKQEAATHSDIPEIFLYTLEVIGEKEAIREDAQRGHTQPDTSPPTPC